jgi:hypothetical protein
MTVGGLTINGFDETYGSPATTINSAIGDIKIQPTALGAVDIFNGKIKFDTDGSLHVNEGALYGNDQIRGIDVSVATGSATMNVTFPTSRASDRYAVVVTPSWKTQVGVSYKDQFGFTVDFSTPAPATGKIDWIIID